jgi:predicted transcriptional regulator
VQFIDGSAFESTKLNSISIEAGNDIFHVEHDFLIDILHHKLIRNFSNSSNIEIPRTIEILCSSCFSKCKSLSSISFESNSRLKRIESSAFSESSLESIEIPQSVEILCSSCFSKCASLSSISFESNSGLKQIESYAFSESSLRSIEIPRSVEILCSSCFSKCASLSSISFESNSRLKRIESYAFSCSSLQSIKIPRNVQFIDGSAFELTKLNSISIEAGNDIFHVEYDFLIDILHHKLIRNFSVSSNIEIPQTIEILGSSCFSKCASLSSISFESNSGLKRIESNAFSESSLESIEIP